MKIFQIDKTYDYKYDLLDISVNNDYKSETTIELDHGVYLDFDEKGVPVALEIISASKVIGIDKKDLSKADIEMFISVSKDLVEVSVKFSYPIHNKLSDVSMLKKVVNEYNLPIMKTTAASA